MTTENLIDQGVQRRIVSALFASQSLFSAATIVSFTLTSIIAADLSGSDLAAGLPSTVTLAARAVLAYPIGWLLDRLGRRLGLSLGYLAGVAGVIISAWSVIIGSFPGFLAGAAFLGGSRASAEQSRYVGAEIFPTSRQSRVIGFIVFAGTIGAIGGPLLVEPSASWAEGLGLNYYAGPFLVGALMLALAGVIVFLLLRPDPMRLGQMVAAGEQPAGTDPADEALKRRTVRQIFRSPTALLAVLSMTIGQMVMALLMVITPLHMNHNEHGTQAISLVIMAHTLGMFGLSWLTGWLIDRVGRLVMIIAGSIVLVTACLLAPLSTTLPLLALALFLLGLGWNFSFVAGSSLLSKQLTSGERGRAQGAGEMAVAFGAGAGSLGSGFLFAASGIMAVSLVGLGFSLALLAMATWFLFQYRPAEALATGRD
jgi:MFS family permease